MFKVVGLGLFVGIPSLLMVDRRLGGDFVQSVE